MASLIVRSMKVGFDDRVLVSDLSFTLDSGQCLALTGKSGSGKTSALRALCLLDDPLEGVLLLDGKTPSAVGYPQWRRRVSWVPGQPSFLDTTLGEELERGRAYCEADSIWEGEHLLEALGIERALSTPVRQLSTGESQRLLLARALRTGPDILLLDEPTSGLDPLSRDRVEALIMRFVEEGGGVVLVSHDAAQRKRLAGSEQPLS